MFGSFLRLISVCMIFRYVAVFSRVVSELWSIVYMIFMAWTMSCLLRMKPGVLPTVTFCREGCRLIAAGRCTTS